MRIVICADDGDQIAVSVDDIETEQSVLRLELHNTVFGEFSDLESITLPLRKARDLADALTRMSDAIERFHCARYPSFVTAGNPRPNGRTLGSTDGPH
jgi:hypothetical protein